MNNKGIKIVVFADLDGSFLNEKYEYDEIEPIVKNLLSLDASIVFASSKTRSEIDYYRKKLQISDPFISENGSSIIIPENYFMMNYGFTKQAQGYNIIELGTTYQIICEKLSVAMERSRAKIVGFGDMTVGEIAKDTGLPLYLAKLAKQREYSEPFKILNGSEKNALQAISNEGLCYTMGGKYLHALGNCDKGKATIILKNLYLQQFKRIISIGVGDSANDLAMLKIVDKPFYVIKPEGRKTVWKKIELIARNQ